MVHQGVGAHDSGFGDIGHRAIEFGAADLDRSVHDGDRCTIVGQLASIAIDISQLIAAQRRCLGRIEHEARVHLAVMAI